MICKRHILLLLAALCIPCGAIADETAEPAEGQVRVGRLIYAENQKTKCFANAFLYAVRRETTIHIHRDFDDVPVDQPALFDHPMVIWFGEGAFDFNDAQVENLRAYLTGGGFVLASSSCLDPKWNASFKQTLQRTLPDHQLEPLPMDHPIFDTIYRIPAVRCSRTGDSQLYGIFLDERLVMVWCPVDLRDVASMGADCCCCGANYVRNAKQINANILAYVLTH